jgi:phosphodiesterase/alkaline phosphatase D-like protein
MPETNDTTTPVKLPLTQRQFAALNGKKLSSVKRVVAQGRVQFERVGGGDHRAASVLIWQREWPAPVAHGGLTEDQRAAWNKGRSTKK